VSEDCIGSLEDVFACADLEAGDGRHGRQRRAAQRFDRIEASERLRDVSGPSAQRPCPQPSLTNSALPEGGDAPERCSRPHAPPERETLAKPDSQPVGMRPATQ